MDSRALERLGHHVVSRRVALGYRTRTDLADSLQFTVRTLADIEHGVRKAGPGTYAMLENKMAWAPGSIDTILAGGEPNETVVELRCPTHNAPSQGYALRTTTAHALSQVSTEQLLLELRRRIIAPRDRRHETGDDWDGLDSRGGPFHLSDLLTAQNHDFFSGSGSSYVIGKAVNTEDEDRDF